MKVTVPLMMQSGACDPDTSANGITCPKSHAASHFDCLDITNVMVPSMIPSVSCAVDTDASLDLMSTVVSFMMPSASHYANAGTHGST